MGRGPFGAILLTIAVFGGGAGLGFGFREGWFPVQWLPAPTGVIDPAAESAADDPPLEVMPGDPSLPDGIPRSAEPGIDSPETAQPILTTERPRPVGPDFDQAIFASQSEPTESPGSTSSMGSPRPLPMDDAAQEIPRVIPRQVDPASFATAESLPAAGTTNLPGELAAGRVGVVANPPEFDLAATIAAYDAKVEHGEILAAHRLLSQAYWKQRSHRPELIERLDQTAAMIFFQPQPHFVEPHVIEPGDRLEAIAGQYKVPWEYLSKLNRVSPQRIQPGRKLKVVRGPFAAVVELVEYSLTVHLQGYYVRRFSVGVGRDGASPIGKFAVLNKVENPQYTDPNGDVIDADDPTNPLGERWIDLGGSYGIHGTIDPGSIGQAASRGCIRLNDKDIVLVYDFLTVGSEVVLRR